MKDISKITLSELKAHSDEYLWQAQQDLEEVVITLGKCRDQYADSLVEYNNALETKKSGQLIDDPKLKVNKATALAKAELVELYTKTIKLEQTKKKLQGYERAITERIQTVKLFMREKSGNYN